MDTAAVCVCLVAVGEQESEKAQLLFMWITWKFVLRPFQILINMYQYLDFFFFFASHCSCSAFLSGHFVSLSFCVPLWSFICMFGVSF